FGLSVVVTAIFYLILNSIDFKKVSYIPGVIFGLAYGVPLMTLAIPLSFSSSASTEMKIIWALLVFIGFGAAVGWSYNELAFPSVAVKPETGESRVEGIDRREFI